MNNLYHKVAVASVCTALGFTLGANTEAKAATLSLEPIITFSVLDFDGSLAVYGGPALFDGLGDQVRRGEFHYLVRDSYGERAGFAEFNIGRFSVAPNTFINSAIFQVEIFTLIVESFGVYGTSPSSLGIFGYVGNGTPESRLSPQQTPKTRIEAAQLTTIRHKLRMYGKCQEDLRRGWKKNW